MISVMRLLCALMLCCAIVANSFALVNCKKKCKNLATTERWFKTEADYDSVWATCYSYDEPQAFTMYTPGPAGGTRVDMSKTITEYTHYFCDLVCDPIAPFPQQAAGGEEPDYQEDIAQFECQKMLTIIPPPPPGP